MRMPEKLSEEFLKKSIALANMRINEKMPQWAFCSMMNNSGNLFYGAQKRTRTSTPCGTRT